MVHKFASLVREGAASRAVSMRPIDCHLLKLLKKHPDGKRFVTDADAKRAVTSSLRELDRNFCYVVKQVLVQLWKNCLKGNVEYIEV
jgi:hypothetical protein